MQKEIPIDPFLAILSGLLYFGLPLLLLFFGEKFKKLLVELSIIIIFAGIGITFYSFYSSISHFSNDALIIFKEASQNVTVKNDKKLPNIYFIWLDEMETGYMKKCLSDPDRHGAFTGFTLFENNSANYLYTQQSYISFMSGSLFKEGSYAEWSQRGDSLRQTLKGYGYTLTAYAKQEYLSSLDDLNYRSEDIFVKWNNSQHPFVEDFTAYWIVRSLPNIFANRSLEMGKIIGGMVSVWFNLNEKYSRVKSISDGIEPLSGVFTLKQLVAEEEYRKDTNEFVMAHAVIPHGPYVIDKTCGLRSGTSLSTSEAYYEQVLCSADLVRTFLEKLKQMNRYDSSLVIIMGDHGSGWAADSIGTLEDRKKPLNEKYMPWNKNMVISRSSALLMIKPPKTLHDTELIISEKESQLVDIYPTILTSIGYAKNKSSYPIDGIDLFSDKAKAREKYITYFKPSKNLNPQEAEIYDLKYSPSVGLVDIFFRSSLKKESDLQSLECKQILNFSSVATKKNSLDYYVADGLSDIEQWGRWTSNKLVHVRVKLPPNGCENSKVIFNLRGFVTESNPIQSSKVIFNGGEIGEIKIKFGEQNPRDFVFSIPPQLIKTGDANNIELLIDKPVSPKSIGISSDPRLLGLGIQTIIFQ